MQPHAYKNRMGKSSSKYLTVMDLAICFYIITQRDIGQNHNSQIKGTTKPIHMALVKKNTGAMCLVALLVISTAFFPCHASRSMNIGTFSFLIPFGIYSLLDIPVVTGNFCVPFMHTNLALLYFCRSKK